MISHLELQNLIISNTELLSKSIEINNLLFQKKEFRINDDSVLDLFYWANFESCYKNPDKLVIEIKPDDAKHDLVGQISKYKYHLENYSVFKHNKIYYVTIALDYDPFILFELSKLNVITIKYSIINNQLQLQKKYLFS